MNVSRTPSDNNELNAVLLRLFKRLDVNRFQ
jgi:hypothetical protein